MGLEKQNNFQVPSRTSAVNHLAPLSEMSKIEGENINLFILIPLGTHLILVLEVSETVGIEEILDSTNVAVKTCGVDAGRVLKSQYEPE